MFLHRSSLIRSESKHCSKLCEDASCVSTCSDSVNDFKIHIY